MRWWLRSTRQNSHGLSSPIAEQFSRLYDLTEMIRVVIGHQQYLTYVGLSLAVRYSRRQVQLRVLNQRNQFFEIREEGSHRSLPNRVCNVVGSGRTATGWAL